MALRRVELEDLLNRPGTYFNPQTEVLIVVDDSPVIDNEIFEDADDGEGDDEWVVLSDETPINEHARDDLIEQFQTRHAPAATSGVPADQDDVEEDEDELEPDED